MRNSSDETSFVLTGLNETRTYKQIYFSFFLVLYLLTIIVNLTLIVTILLEKILHEPMYILLCNLCFNGIYGSSGFYPKFLHDLLSDADVISYSLCLTQIFVLYSYILCEITNLSVMAYDRYVAICKPLEYHSIMTHKMLRILITLSWLFPFLEQLISVMLTTRLPLCGSRVDRLYCSNWDVVKLSCTNNTLNNVVGYIVIILQLVQVFFIMVSYSYIISATLKSQEEHRKFTETCLPHLISLANFVVSTMFDVMYSRYGSSTNLQIVRHMLSVEFLVVPPLLNPLIYGLKLKQIRRCMFKMYNKRIAALI